MRIKTLKDFNVKDKLVLLRIDADSPVANKKVLDNPRLSAAAKTISYLIKHNAKVVIVAHQGRKGNSDFLDLKQHAKILSKILKKSIKYIDSLFEEKALNEIDKLESGEAIVLKNVRSYDDELNTSKKTNRFIAFSNLFDLYVNDAFSVLHRNQSSIVIPPKYISSCIGLNLEKEINYLENFKSPKSKNTKSVYLVGGQKIDDYLPLFKVLKNKNNTILASGVLANLFLISQGYKLGYENEWARKNNYSKTILKLKSIYSKYKDQIVLPVDFALGNSNILKAKRNELSLEDLPSKNKIWDLGPRSVFLFKRYIEESNYLFMKGPLGYSEIKDFSYSTVEILKFISKLSKSGQIFSLLGGGHLTTTAEKYNIPNNFSHISLSGGALIAYISGETLPGLEALKS